MSHVKPAPVRILLIDNYDSFTYNLVHYLEGRGEVVVCQNDEPLPPHWLSYDLLVLSPGPGLPSESGNLMRIISEAWGCIPILGVCLGHQALIEFAGGQLYNLPQVFHGVPASIEVMESGRLFTGVPSPFEAGLYHSWAAGFVPADFRITARSTEGVVMAVEHRSLPVAGVQFHPESIMTPWGLTILNNFCKSLRNRQFPSGVPVSDPAAPEPLH